MWADGPSATQLEIPSTFMDGTTFWWKKSLSVPLRNFPPPEMTCLSLKPEVMVTQGRETRFLEDLAKQLTCWILWSIGIISQNELESDSGTELNEEFLKSAQHAELYWKPASYFGVWDLSAFETLSQSNPKATKTWLLQSFHGFQEFCYEKSPLEMPSFLLRSQILPPNISDIQMRNRGYICRYFVCEGERQLTGVMRWQIPCGL